MRHLPLLAGLALLTGCGTRAEPKPDPVAFTAAVTLPGGRPARDVTAVFVPDTAAQTAGRYRVTEKGELAPAPGGALTLIPGGYTVRFEPIDGRTPAEESRYRAAFETIPAKYREGQPEGFKVTVADGQRLAITLD
ncbi:MAG: hypothetical protein C0501_07530 [Isosphaera sp.]|nr:hypothetical protein [Isosphaera sp.]